MSDALTDQQLLDYAHQAGFQGDTAITAVATAKAESGGRPDELNSNGNVPESSVDRGVLQFNSFWHPEVSDECAFDPACAFREAYRVSNGGADFGAWVATGTDRFTSILSDLRSSLGGGTTSVGPTGPTGPGDTTSSSTLPILTPAGVGARVGASVVTGSGTTGGGIGGLGNPLEGVAAAINNLGTAITKPVADIENSFHRAVWTSAFVGLGLLMIGAGLLLYFRRPAEREGQRIEKIGAAA